MPESSEMTLEDLNNGIKWLEENGFEDLAERMKNMDILFMSPSGQGEFNFSNLKKSPVGNFDETKGDSE